MRRTAGASGRTSASDELYVARVAGLPREMRTVEVFHPSSFDAKASGIST